MRRVGVVKLLHKMWDILTKTGTAPDLAVLIDSVASPGVNSMHFALGLMEMGVLCSSLALLRLFRPGDPWLPGSRPCAVVVTVAHTLASMMASLTHRYLVVAHRVSTVAPARGESELVQSPLVEDGS